MLNKFWKILICAFYIFLFCLSPSEAREITFIYLNGTNTTDDASVKWFHNGIKKAHPNIKKAFEEDSFTREKFLKNGEDTINPSEKTLFWGGMSTAELEELRKKLNYSRAFSPRAAHWLRKFFAYYIHDSIWATKYENFAPIVEKLHKSIMEEYSKGRQSVLMGYSAGSFIIHEYAIGRARYFTPEKYLSTLSEDTIKQLSDLDVGNTKNTCIAALGKLRLAVIEPSGDLFSNGNVKFIRENYPKLNDYTEKYCMPDDAIKGIINYASPFSLYYSEMSNLDKSMSINSKNLYVYMIENGKFWLTINWSNDPFSYPAGKNRTIEKAGEILQREIKPNDGFVYDKSDEKSPTMFLLAHNSYWDNSKKFAKNITKAYRDGFCSYYPEKHCSKSE